MKTLKTPIILRYLKIIKKAANSPQALKKTISQTIRKSYFTGGICKKNKLYQKLRRDSMIPCNIFKLRYEPYSPTLMGKGLSIQSGA
ncbi:MAG: hypothetical protein K2Y01_09670 [Rhabdochlamydiaceae bacterium]|nr:hypothetical protein [Rhabdochlamydiaceae bacterium]